MARRALGLLALLSGCELVSGLQGERGFVAVAKGGAAGAQASSTSGYPAQLVGGAGQAPSDNGGAPSSGVHAGEGGSEAGGASESLAGAGQSEQLDDPEVAIALTTASCVGPALSGCRVGVEPCLTLSVPGGEFEMGRSDQPDVSDYFPTGPTSELPGHRTRVNAFQLDKFEVVVGRFRRFVEAYDGVPPAPEAGANPRVKGSGWNPEWNQKLPVNREALRALLGRLTRDNEQATWSDQPGSGECRPMNGIDWFVAFAFCIWDGGRLPSETEWEFAAAGGSQERFFPWGSALPEGRTVHACAFSGSSSCTPDDIPPIGSFAALGRGRYGHADLAGSVAELMRDVYDADFYSRPMARADDAINLNYDEQNFTATVRGGAYHSPGHSLRVASRLSWERRESAAVVGIRCARSP